MVLNQKHLATVVPELKAWNHGRGISPEDWVSALGSIPAALLYSSIFWPDFMEYEGCLLFRHDNIADTSFDDWMASLAGDRTAVERVMNHRHLTDFFLNAPEQPTDEQVEYFGHLLQEMWLCKLRKDFPHLPVRVEFYWHDREATDDAQITVFLER